MKKKGLNFKGGDVVKDDYGTWARVCLAHSQGQKKEDLDEYPGDGALCDVYRCKNKADYYLSLD